MKKSIFLTLVFMLAHMGLFAQFEGTITYDVKLSGDMAEQMQGMMFNKMVYTIKGNNLKQKMEGGSMSAMIGDILVKEGETYMIQHKSKTASKVDSKDTEKTEAPKVEKTSETTTISGYLCTKYIVESETPQGTVTETIWATDDIKIGVKNASDLKMMKKGVNGFPLKMVQSMMNDMIVITMTANKIDKSKVPDIEFAIPPDYKVEKFDANKMMKGLGGEK